MSDLAPGPDLGAAVWLAAVRRSHDRLAQRLSTLTEVDATRPSYAQEWTVADVASHLGSQAEIFELFLRAGVSEQPCPAGSSAPARRSPTSDRSWSRGPTPLTAGC